MVELIGSIRLIEGGEEKRTPVERQLLARLAALGFEISDLADRMVTAGVRPRTQSDDGTDEVRAAAGFHAHVRSTALQLRRWWPSSERSPEHAYGSNDLLVGCDV